MLTSGKDLELQPHSVDLNWRLPTPASEMRGPGSAKAGSPHGNALLRAGNTLRLLSSDI